MPAIIRGNVIFGAHERVRTVDTVISAEQVLALNATPITIVAAPGANRALIFEGCMIRKPAGTAYGGIAAGEDLAVKYTGAAGLQVGSAETTGFLDQTTNQFRWCQAYRAASLISDILPVVNDVLVMHLLVGEITTGDSPLNVRTFFRVIPTDI